MKFDNISISSGTEYNFTDILVLVRDKFVQNFAV